MEQTPGSEFREYLRKELSQRSGANPRYSLRSFAKSLGISVSGLSMILNGKKAVSLNFIEKISKKLDLSEEQIQQHQILLLGERAATRLEPKQFEFIDDNKFPIIKEWYHYAILNLLRTHDFQPKTAWIAKRLGICFADAQSAVEKLQQAGLLQIKDGVWKDLTSQFTSHTNNKKASEAARQNQIQLFTKALAAISEVTFEERNHTGVTIAISKSDLDKAKEFITEFRKKFMEKFDRKHNADDVYQMSVALFPLTQKD